MPVCVKLLQDFLVCQLVPAGKPDGSAGDKAVFLQNMLHDFVFFIRIHPDTLGTAVPA